MDDGAFIGLILIGVFIGGSMVGCGSGQDEVANHVCVQQGFTDGRWSDNKVLCRTVTPAVLGEVK